MKPKLMLGILVLIACLPFTIAYSEYFGNSDRTSMINAAGAPVTTGFAKIESSLGSLRHPMIFGNMDGIGEKENVIYKNSIKTIYVMSSNLVARSSYLLPHPMTSYALWDLDGNGRDELIVGLNSPQISILILSLSGNTLTAVANPTKVVPGNASGYNELNPITCGTFGTLRRCYFTKIINRTTMVISTLYYTGGSYVITDPAIVTNDMNLTLPTGYGDFPKAWFGSAPTISNLYLNGTYYALVAHAKYTGHWTGISYPAMYTGFSQRISSVNCGNNALCGSTSDVRLIAQTNPPFFSPADSIIPYSAPVVWRTRDSVKAVWVSMHYAGLSNYYDRYARIFSVTLPSGEIIEEHSINSQGLYHYFYGEFQCALYHSSLLVYDIDSDGYKDICFAYNGRRGSSCDSLIESRFKCIDNNPSIPPHDRTIVNFHRLPIGVTNHNAIMTYSSAMSGTYFVSTGGNIFKFICKGDDCSTTKTFISVFNSTRTFANSQLIDLNNDGELDLIVQSNDILDVYIFPYQGVAPPPTQNVSLKFILREYPSLNRIANYRLYDIDKGINYYTNPTGEVTIQARENSTIRFFGHKDNQYTFAGFTIYVPGRGATPTYNWFPKRTGILSIDKEDEKTFVVNLLPYLATSTLITQVKNKGVDVPATRIYNVDYDIMFPTDGFGRVIWAVSDGKYDFLLLDYNLPKSALKQGQTTAVWDIGGGGGLAGNQVCLPNSNNLCLDPFIQNNNFYCDIDDIYSCTTNCFDYRCDDCFYRDFCVFIDYFGDYSASPTYYGWFTNGSMEYRYVPLDMGNYIRSVLLLSNVTTAQPINVETPSTSYSCKYPTCPKHYLMFSMLVNTSSSKTGVIFTSKDPEGKLIFSMRVRNVIGTKRYNTLELYDGNNWVTFINGSTQYFPPTPSLYRITIDLQAQKYTLEVDADEDMVFDYSTERNIIEATTKESHLYTFTPESVSGRVFVDDFQVIIASFADICTNFYDDFKYSSSIQTGKGWFGDLIFPSTDYCTQQAKEYFDSFLFSGAKGYYDKTPHICFDANVHNSIGFITNCYSKGNIFEMDFAFFPDSTMNNNPQIRFVGSGGEKLIVQFRTSTASLVIPNKRSKLALWNGVGWVETNYEFSDFRYHRLSVFINFNTKTISILLDENIPILLHEPIYITQSYIESIEIRKGDNTADKSVLEIFGVYWNSESVTPSFNSILQQLGYNTPDGIPTDWQYQTGLRTHYPCGWNFSAVDGNYFNWNLCTPPEAAKKSTWCILRVLGRCSIGNLTNWILNNFLFALVLMLVLALFIPFIVRSRAR